MYDLSVVCSNLLNFKPPILLFMRSTTEPVIVKHDSRNSFPLCSTMRGPGVPIEQRRKSMFGLSMKIHDLGRKYWFKLDE